MDSFLSLKPSIGVILNITPEHLDYFKNFNNIVKSFNNFAQKSKIVAINYDYANFLTKKHKNL